MIVRDVMSADPVVATERTTVGGAIELLSILDVRHLPVTENDVLVGIISDRDVRHLTTPIAWNVTVAANPDDERLNEAASTIMSGGALTVEPTTPVTELVDLMVSQKVGAVVVTEARNRVVGIVSYVDLLRLLGTLLSAEPSPT